MSDAEISANAVEFIKDRLYYIPLKERPVKRKRHAFFSIDDELEYWNFYLDFGPLNLGQLYRFCVILLDILKDPALENKKIFYYSSTQSDKRANAAFLISAFAMIYLNRTPEEAFMPFRSSPPFPPFHDATPIQCTYNLTIPDCLSGLCEAMKLKYFDFNQFNVEEYEHYERVENGDFNWLVQNKFLAFAGPFEMKRDIGDGYLTLTPEDYIPYFKKNGVTLVIRLNRKCYDEKRFIRHGIKHVDLFYPDGSNPPESILQKFLKVCEGEKGAIAVHCKAGLGRTGSCIGCYMMKHHGMTAAQAIGWMRIARPGSVIGPQQHFLQENEARMHQEGQRYRANVLRKPKQCNDSETKLNNNAIHEKRLMLESKEWDSESAQSLSSSSDSQDMRIVFSQGDHLRLRKEEARSTFHK